MTTFAPATKKRAKLRLALSGPSGSGKTWSALRLASGLGGKIAVIDTERGSASLYSDAFRFDVCEIEPPYTPERYIEAIHTAEAAGYDVLVIDSLSHAWAGEGGILESVDARQSQGGNKFVAWGPATKSQNALINAILGSRCHLIATLRAKQEYAMEQDARGKQVIKKLGMAPVQRDGVEYEFGVVLDLTMDHRAGVVTAGKDRTRLFAGKEPAELTEEHGHALSAWLNSGEAEKPREVTAEDVRACIGVALKTGGWTTDQVRDALSRWSAKTAADVPAESRADAISLFHSPPNHEAK